MESKEEVPDATKCSPAPSDHSVPTTPLKTVKHMSLKKRGSGNEEMSETEVTPISTRNTRSSCKLELIPKVNTPVIPKDNTPASNKHKGRKGWPKGVPRGTPGKRAAKRRSPGRPPAKVGTFIAET